MNTTIRNLIVAAPLATAALTLVPAAAMASEPGPVKVAAAPEPVEPKDKVVAPKPSKPSEPKGPGDITNPKPCPTHGVDCTPDGDDGGSKDSADDTVDTFDLPTRVDAGVAPEEQPGELDLAWLFAGGLAVTASGVAFAVRKRTRSNV